MLKAGLSYRVNEMKNNIVVLACWSIVGLVVWLFVWAGGVNDEIETTQAGCANDLKCLAGEHQFEAVAACIGAIEENVPGATWVNGFAEPKFDQVAWLNQAQGIITYAGNKLVVPDSNGNQVQIQYWCDWNTTAGAVFNYRVKPAT